MFSEAGVKMSEAKERAQCVAHVLNAALRTIFAKK